MAKIKGKTLAQLKEDLAKAQRDKQVLLQQAIMVDGIISYLSQEIQKLEEVKS